jgi:hypothetical protein
MCCKTEVKVCFGQEKLSLNLLFINLSYFSVICILGFYLWEGVQFPQEIRSNLFSTGTIFCVYRCSVTESLLILFSLVRKTYTVS